MLKDKNGFTLVELVASLTLAGLLAVALMTIVVTALNGFFLSRDAAEISQKAGMALARIRVELLNATQIISADSNKIEYKTTDGTYEIERSGNLITLAKTAGTGTISAQTLVDNIASDYGTDHFLEYQKVSGAWTTSDDLSELYTIAVKLKFTNYNDTLETMVNPRLNTLRNSPRLS